MLWLWSARDVLPPSVGPRLERLSAPAFALIELAWLSIGCVGLLKPAAGVIVRELVTDVPPASPLQHRARPLGAAGPG